MKFFYSPYNDPYLNAAIELWLSQKDFSGKESLLLLYQSNQSFNIGNGQNIFSEASVSILNELQIPIIRRISGGGAVFHDLGNLNLSLFTSLNSLESLPSLIIKIFKKYFNIELISNELNALYLDGKKVSGNAKRLGNKMSLSQSTLLFDCGLDILNYICRPYMQNIYKGGVKSRYDLVGNIKEIGVSLSEFIEIVKSNYESEKLELPTKTELLNISLERNSVKSLIYLNGPFSYKGYSFKKGEAKLGIESYHYLDWFDVFGITIPKEFYRKKLHE